MGHPQNHKLQHAAGSGAGGAATWWGRYLEVSNPWVYPNHPIAGWL